MSKNLLVLSVVLISVVSLIFMPFIMEGLEDLSDDADGEHGEDDLIFTSLKILVPAWVLIIVVVLLVKVIT